MFPPLIAIILFTYVLFARFTLFRLVSFALFVNSPLVSTPAPVLSLSPSRMEMMPLFILKSGSFSYVLIKCSITLCRSCQLSLLSLSFLSDDLEVSKSTSLADQSVFLIQFRLIFVYYDLIFLFL